MATTNFDTGTVIAKEWLNDVDEAIYETLPTVITNVTTNTTDITNKASKGENSDITKLSGIANPSGGIGISGYRNGNLYMQWTGYSNAAVVRFRRADGSNTVPTKVLSAELLGQIEFQGYDEVTSSFSTGAYIRATAGEDWTDTAHGTYIDVFTTADGIITPARVFRFKQNGDFYGYANGEVAGNVTVGGTLTVGGVPITGPETRNIKYAQIVSATGTAAIPNDDTLPTSSEGAQIATLTITPSTSSKKIRLSCSLSAYLVTGLTGTECGLILALFNGTNCIATSRVRNLPDSTSFDNTFEANMGIETIHSPASSSAQTYSLRIGKFGTGTWYANGPTSIDHSGALDNTYLIAEEID